MWFKDKNVNFNFNNVYGIFVWCEDVIIYKMMSIIIIISKL